MVIASSDGKVATEEIGCVEEAFWSALLERCVDMAHARCAWIFRSADSGLRPFVVWPESGGIGRFPGVSRRAEQAAGQALGAGRAISAPGEFGGLVALRLEGVRPEEAAVVVLLVEAGAQSLERLAGELAVLAQEPRIHDLSRSLDLARREGDRLLEILLLTAEVTAARRFVEAAMLLCNQMAARFSLDGVSLGWLEQGLMRLQAASHMDGFDRATSLVKSMEAAMDEACDLDEEILFPPAGEEPSVTRDHDRLHQEQGGGHLLTLPVRVRGEPVAAVLCMRRAVGLTEEEVRLLRLAVDMLQPGMALLKREERGVGTRLLELSRRRLEHLWGVGNSWAKLWILLLLLTVGVLNAGSWLYRVEAGFVLATDDVRVLAAPFNGYIEGVYARIGDLVVEKQKLLTLDRRGLWLEEAAATAEVARYAREADKAKSQHALAEMRIAQAQMAQAQARMDKVAFQLAAAEVSAPVPGVVVEGELDKLLGAPVKEGDLLFRVASVERLYVEIDLMERDLHEVAVGKGGEIAFLGRPQESFPVEVERIDPISVVKRGQNVFVVRARILGKAANWWRPGMSGMAKLEVEERSLLWIFTHRMVEFLRLLFWW
ncbi:MAG: efflux RND transporter periplasmic adaptor subunit [Magnetococcus sp. MYC-9]